MSEGIQSVRKSKAGFTLLELLISMALLLVISSVAIGGMAYFQRNYRSSEERKSLQGKLRATVEQLSQEIGQAGLVPSGLSGNLPSGTPYIFNQSTVGAMAYLTAASAAGATVLSVSSTAGMYAGEWVILDTPDLNQTLGTPEERVQIVSINSSALTITVSATTNAHTPTASNAVPIIAQGVYPMGVWTNTAVSLPDANNHAQTLTIFGDINADGSMVVVKYQCPATSTTTGPLLRKQYNVSASPTNTGCGATAVPDVTTTLIDNVTFCQFTYQAITANGHIYAPSVGISLTVQSINKDLQTGSTISVTKNILNIQPRNIVNAYNMDLNPLAANSSEDSYTSQLQTLPATLSPQSILSSNCIP